MCEAWAFESEKHVSVVVGGCHVSLLAVKIANLDGEAGRLAGGRVRSPGMLV